MLQNFWECARIVWVWACACDLAFLGYLRTLYFYYQFRKSKRTFKMRICRILSLYCQRANLNVIEYAISATLWGVLISPIRFERAFVRILQTHTHMQPDVSTIIRSPVTVLARTRNLMGGFNEWEYCIYNTFSMVNFVGLNQRIMVDNRPASPYGLHYSCQWNMIRINLQSCILNTDRHTHRTRHTMDNATVTTHHHRHCIQQYENDSFSSFNLFRVCGLWCMEEICFDYIIKLL